MPYDRGNVQQYKRNPEVHKQNVDRSKPLREIHRACTSNREHSDSGV